MNIFKPLKKWITNIIKKSYFMVPLFLTIILIAFCENAFCEDSNPISVQIEHATGSELDFTITNNGSKDLFFSSYDIPMRGHYKQYFKITDESGLEVPYVGMYALIKQTRDMWHFIESGESIDFSVELFGEYNFSRTSGTYNIEFISSVTVKDVDERRGTEDEEYIPTGNSQIYTVKSNEIENEIDITYSDNPESASSRALCPCSSGNISYISQTSAKAKSILSQSFKYLKNKKTDSVWQALFGKANNNRYTFTMNGLKKIKASFQKSWAYNCPTEPKGAIAYVYKDKPYQVWLCPPFFKNTSSSNKLKFNGSALAHEASHWNAIIGTSDYAYYNDCAALAKQDPNKAIHNADSYRQYIMNASN